MDESLLPRDVAAYEGFIEFRGFDPMEVFVPFRAPGVGVLGEGEAPDKVGHTFKVPDEGGLFFFVIEGEMFLRVGYIPGFLLAVDEEHSGSQTPADEVLGDIFRDPTWGCASDHV